MKGEFSRDTFDPIHRYSSVRLQQGRVVTDADWNEQADITRHRAEREAVDVIGRCGAPLDAAGFQIGAATYPLAVSSAGATARVVGEDGTILATDDGGATWTLRETGTTARLRAVSFAGSTGWAVGDSGTILKTEDGGTTWTAQESGVSVTLRGVFAVDAT